MQEVYKEFRGILINGTKEINEINEMIQELQKKIDAGIYTVERTREFKNAVFNLKIKKQNLVPQIIKDATATIDDYIEQLELQDTPRGEQITADAKLLTSGIRLKPQEVIALMEKEENQNVTMHRLFYQYAQEHGIKLPLDTRAYIGNENAIREANSIKAISNYYERWIDKTNNTEMLHKFLASADEQYLDAQNTDE